MWQKNRKICGPVTAKTPNMWCFQSYIAIQKSLSGARLKPKHHFHFHTFINDCMKINCIITTETLLLRQMTNWLKTFFYFCQETLTGDKSKLSVSKYVNSVSTVLTEMTLLGKAVGVADVITCGLTSYMKVYNFPEFWHRRLYIGRFSAYTL